MTPMHKIDSVRCKVVIGYVFSNNKYIYTTVECIMYTFEYKFSQIRSHLLDTRRPFLNLYIIPWFCWLMMIHWTNFPFGRSAKSTFVATDYWEIFWELSFSVQFNAIQFLFKWQRGIICKTHIDLNTRSHSIYKVNE
jgi:hypothetical protein